MGGGGRGFCCCLNYFLGGGDRGEKNQESLLKLNKKGECSERGDSNGDRVWWCGKTRGTSTQNDETNELRDSPV